MQQTIYRKTAGYDTIIAVKSHMAKKRLYKKYRINIAALARDAWDSALKQAEIEFELRQRHRLSARKRRA
jgi:hypothetical protein